jgi:hypothetical protein
MYKSDEIVKQEVLEVLNKSNVYLSTADIAKSLSIIDNSSSYTQLTKILELLKLNQKVSYREYEMFGSYFINYHQRMSINQKITRRGFLADIFPTKNPNKNLFQFSIMNHPFPMKFKNIGGGHKCRRRAKYSEGLNDFLKKNSVIKFL